MSFITRGKVLDLPFYVFDTDGEAHDPDPAPGDAPPKPIDVASLEYVCVQVWNGYSDTSGEMLLTMYASNIGKIVGFGSLQGGVPILPDKIVGPASVSGDGVAFTQGNSLLFYKDLPHYLLPQIISNGGVDPKEGDFVVHIYGWMV
jgi:hypothetical protein